MRRRRDERGQAVPVLAVLVALTLASAAAVARLGGAAVDAAEARTGADAAALAGAQSGRAAAVRLAALNGGVLAGFRSQGDTVEVDVRVGHAHATARAGLEDIEGEAIRR